MDLFRGPLLQHGTLARDIVHSATGPQFHWGVCNLAKEFCKAHCSMRQWTVDQSTFHNLPGSCPADIPTRQAFYPSRNIFVYDTTNGATMSEPTAIACWWNIRGNQTSAMDPILALDRVIEASSVSIIFYD